MKENQSLHFSVPVPRGRERFRELIIYASCKSVDDQFFGAIKLNKILYYSDFMAFYRFGMPLTGLPYFKLRYGPAPQHLLPIRTSLINEGALQLVQVEIGGHLQDRTVALRGPYMSLFTKDEVGLVDEVIASLWRQTATEVSDASHDVKWRTLEIKDRLPYEFAFLDDELTPEDVERSHELASRLGW